MANCEIIYQTENRLMGLDVLLCKHCNLRCRACSRYCNISKPKFYDFETLKEDLKKIAATGITISRFTFTGGEPLLYPHLAELLEYARSLFPYPGMSIFTNGKAIKNLSPEFFEVCRKNRIDFTYTDYAPVDNDFNRKLLKENYLGYHNIIEYADEGENAEVRTFDDDFSKKKFFLHKLTKNIKPIHHRNQCYCDCPCLWDSKIWICSTCAFSETLNETYGTDFQITEKDYLKVDDLKTIDDYLEYIRIDDDKPFCKYCCNSAPEVIEWEQGKGTIEDFVE